MQRIIKLITFGIILLFPLCWVHASGFGTFYGIFYYHKKGLIDIKELNLSFIRLNICWGDIQPRESVFLYDSTPIKRIKECIENGIKVIPVIRTAKAEWILKHKHKEVSYPPKDLENTYNEKYGYSKSYYEFVKRVVEPFKDSIPIVVIENEVLSKKFWGGSLDDYIRLLITAKKAIKDVNPKIKVADSGIASFSWGFLMVKELLNRGRQEDAFKLYKKYFEYAYFYKVDSFLELKKLMKTPRVKKHIENAEYLIERIKDIVDIFNFHYYENPDLFSYLVDYIKRKIGDKPLMCNELGVRYKLGAIRREEKACIDLIKKFIFVKINNLEATIFFPYYNDEHNIVGLGDRTSPNIVFDTFKTTMRFLNYPPVSFLDLSTSCIKRYSFLFSKFKVEILWGNEDTVFRKPYGCKVYDYQGREIKKDSINLDEKPIFVLYGEF